MALEELSTTVSKLTFNFFGSESEKKVRYLLGFSCLQGAFWARTAPFLINFPIRVHAGDERGSFFATTSTTTVVFSTAVVLV